MTIISRLRPCELLSTEAMQSLITFLELQVTIDMVRSIPDIAFSGDAEGTVKEAQGIQSVIVSLDI